MDNRLRIGETNLYIYPGSRVKLGRFATETWVAQHGWYSWGGNRPVCGWYLESLDNRGKLKPLQFPDLDDIYLIH